MLNRRLLAMMFLYNLDPGGTDEDVVDFHPLHLPAHHRGGLHGLTHGPHQSSGLLHRNRGILAHFLQTQSGAEMVVEIDDEFS